MIQRFLPPTVNLHTLAACNYRCGFCFAGFASAGRATIPQPELHEILSQLASAPHEPGSGPRKATFAGGEPLLSRTAAKDIQFASSLGLITSLVTNGSLLTDSILESLAPHLDWLTLSIDSPNEETNRRIGRASHGSALTTRDYLARIHRAQALGIKVKVNTVVNRANLLENFGPLIREARPTRWKLFQTTRIEEENGLHHAHWMVTDDEFRQFVARQETLAGDATILVPETQAEIYGTYAMIAPNGCFYDNSGGTYIYSKPITEVGIESAWASIDFSIDRFLQRKGNYDFVTGQNRPEAHLRRTASQPQPPDPSDNLRIQPLALTSDTALA